MPIRIAPSAAVIESSTIVPRNLPNNRPSVMVRPDWTELPKVTRSWATEVTGSVILDQEQRVGRRSRPRISATSLHHGTSGEETSWVWNLLEGASPQLIIPLLQRAELSAPVDYSWPFAIMADAVEVSGTPSDLGGGLARFPATTSFRRFAVGARVWVFSNAEPPASQITQGTRRIPGLLLVVDDVQATHIDVELDIPVSGTSFPRSVSIAPAFDAIPLFEMEGEYPTCGRLQTEITAAEYPGANQYPPLNNGDVSGIYTYFLGDPVWMPDHNWSQGLSGGFARSGGSSSVGRGSVSVLSGTNPRLVAEVSSLLSRELWWDILHLFDSRRGSLRALWVVTNVGIFDGLVVAAPTTGFSGLPQRGWETHLESVVEAVGFVRANGTFEIAEVDSITFDSPSGTLDLVTVQAIPAGTYTKVVIAFRGRFESDELEEEWHTCDVVESSFRLVQLNPESSLSI